MKHDKRNVIILTLGVVIIILVILLTGALTNQIANQHNARTEAKIAALETTQKKLIERLQLATPPVDGADGYTPVKGVDYFDGKNGKDGKDSVSTVTTLPGKNGLSAYDLAVKNGFVGTETQWLASLKGTPGIGVSVQLNPVTGDLEVKRDNDDFPTVLIECNRLLVGCPIGAL